MIQSTDYFHNKYNQIDGRCAEKREIMSIKDETEDFVYISSFIDPGTYFDKCEY